MNVLVSDLVEACDYRLSYFHKLLTVNRISNHVMLDRSDLLKLRDGVKVVGKHSHSLRIYIDEKLNENSSKVRL